MDIDLSPDRQAFIEREVARGAGTPEEIAERALRLYEQQLERLRADIAEADAQIQRGESLLFEADVFAADQDARFALRIKNAAD